MAKTALERENEKRRTSSRSVRQERSSFAQDFPLDRFGTDSCLPTIIAMTKTANKCNADEKSIAKTRAKIQAIERVQNGRNLPFIGEVLQPSNSEEKRKRDEREQTTNERKQTEPLRLIDFLSEREGKEIDLLPVGFGWRQIADRGQSQR